MVETKDVRRIGLGVGHGAQDEALLAVLAGAGAAIGDLRGDERIADLARTGRPGQALVWRS